jgi:ornithine carbamoyltransferase
MIRSGGRMPSPHLRHFLDIHRVDAPSLRLILEQASLMKRQGGRERPLLGRTLALIFEKPSTRTRVSFEVGMRQLGGEVTTLTGREIQLGHGETVGDTARALSRYVDIIMIRTNDEAKLFEMAEASSVPVINGLTDISHPCQIMADVMTFEERKGPIRGRRIAWVGDANNVCQSWIHAAVQFGFELQVAAPAELQPTAATLDWVREQGGQVIVSADPVAACTGVDAIVTDTWVSMHNQDGQRRHNLLQPYQVNEALMARAAADAIFLHCLPAHRGEEVTSGVIDGPQSAVWDAAENRLHAQKGILAWCLNT